MMEALPQFVPQEVCLACDGCCRFKEKESDWRPKVAPEEVESKKEKVQALSKALDKEYYVKTVEGKGCFTCTFYHEGDHLCDLYKVRPFECRLYPFLLTKKEHVPAVSVHISCPYVQEHEHSNHFQRYVDSLKDYFRRGDALKFVLRNPSLPRQYPQHEEEIKYLFKLV